VDDTTPPALSVTAAPLVLWPPDHRMVPVNVFWSAVDACSRDVEVLVTAGASSEPDDARGGKDGSTTGDIAGLEPGTADGSVLLRAERNVAGPGRVYTLTYVATDSSGRAATGTATVTVPTDRPDRASRSKRDDRPRAGVRRR